MCHHVSIFVTFQFHLTKNRDRLKDLAEKRWARGDLPRVSRTKRGETKIEEWSERNSVAIERQFDNCGPSKSRATDDRPDESHERGRKNAQCTCLYLFCIISSALPKVSSARQVLFASLSFFFPFSSQHLYDLFSLFAFLLILLNWSMLDGKLYHLRFGKICHNVSFPKMSNETYIYEFRNFYFIFCMTIIIKELT